MSKSPRWEEWAGIGLGAWLLVSPWVLGFSYQRAPAANAVLIGILVMFREAFELIAYKKSRHHDAGGGSADAIEVRNPEPESLVGLA